MKTTKKRSKGTALTINLFKEILLITKDFPEKKLSIELDERSFIFYKGKLLLHHKILADLKERAKYDDTLSKFKDIDEYSEIKTKNNELEKVVKTINKCSFGITIHILKFDRKYSEFFGDYQVLCYQYELNTILKAIIKRLEKDLSECILGSV